MIEAVLPSSVRSAETFEDLLEEALFPEERAMIASAVEKRRNEFTSARACARIALAKLGMKRPAMLPGVCGAPSWPPGVVGSITHCVGYRAVAVARDADILALGIDAEPHERLPSEILEMIALPQEQARIAKLGSGNKSVRWDRLLFSAKESVYKAWFPMTGRWLGFEEADVVISGSDRTFIARLLVDGPVVQGRQIETFTGTWQAGQGLIITAVVLPRREVGEREARGSMAPHR